MPLLAHFLDDCWEPAAALTTLRRIAGPRQAEGVRASCLKVSAGDLAGARIVSADAKGEEPEAPGAAAYLWVLSAGAPPTRAELIALYREHLEASDDSA